MTLCSLPIPITFRGRPAKVEVLRNNGHCWGEITAADGRRYQVVTARDWYDHPDEEVAAAFERAARHRPASVTPVEESFR